MTTSLAFLASMSAVTWLRPYLAKTGFFSALVEVDLSPADARFSASEVRRAFFSCFDSGLYLLRSWKSWVAVFLSRVWVNWAIAGGT